MLAVSGIGTSTVMPRSTRSAPAVLSEPEAPACESRALIAIPAPPPAERSGTASRRPLAAFLAQLIATQTQAPQTRVRRRAEPEDATGTYLAATALSRRARTKFERRA